MEKIISIEGMSCKHCVMHVQNALSELEGITKVDVNLSQKSAKIQASKDISDEEIKNAIEDAGYEVVKIQ